MTDVMAHSQMPSVNRISKADVQAALKAGIADLQKAPGFGLFFGILFSLAGIAIWIGLINDGSTYWIFPIAAGFPLLGPFAAVGLYEVSRRLEAGEPLEWGPILSAGFRQKNGQLPYFAVLAVFIFLFWIVLARVIFALSFGTASMTNVMSSFELFFTGNGLAMLFVGSIVGGALAALLFSVCVIGVPLLLDRDIDVVTAMLTSVYATIENKEAMLYWGGLIAVAIIVAMLPLFLGMILVFPILGHTSWHIYRKVLDPDISAQPTSEGQAQPA